MNAEHINPFIEASQGVMKQITGLDVKMGKVFVKTSPYKSDSVIVIVGITGKIRGQVVFTMSSTMAMRIASSMMGGYPINELDEISKSAISELTNMIMGNTATLLYNKGVGIEITPPSLLMGDNMQISASNMKTICIPLSTEEGMLMEIDISVKDN